jgi:hypothetical protein
VNHTVIVQLHLIQATDARDINQRTGLAVIAPQLDEQIGASRDDAGLGSVLG